MIYTFRNPAFADDGGIECDIDLGGRWVPHLVHEDDNPEFFALISEAGGIAPYVAPPPPVVTDADKVLTRPQFAFLLALAGFDDVWDALGAGAKATGDMVAYATLKAERDRSAFRLDRVLAIVETFRATAAQIAPDVDLSEAAIRAAWAQAEQFQGAS